MGYVQRDGIERLRHAKRYSRQKSTFCTTLSDAGWKAGYGKRWGVSPVEAGEHAGLWLIWGTNPVNTHVNLMNHLAKAKKRGAKVVVVDVYRTGTAEIADIHLAPRPGTDGALACAMAHVLFAEDLADRGLPRPLRRPALRAARPPLRREDAGVGRGDLRRPSREDRRGRPALWAHAQFLPARRLRLHPPEERFPPRCTPSPACR